MICIKIFGYARVSTKNQNLQRQIDALVEYGVEERKIFIDKISGKVIDRPDYNRLKNIIDSGDTIVIKELDRLSRSMDGIKKEYQYFIDNNINIIVLDNPMLSIDKNKSDLEKKLISNVVLEILAYTAEKELKLKRQRQMEGIKVARENGIKFGRRQQYFVDDKFIDIYNVWKSGKMTGVSATDKLNISRSTYYRMVDDYENNMLEKIENEFNDGTDPVELLNKMESIFKIPCFDSDVYNEKNKDIIKLYKKISDSRNL